MRSSLASELVVALGAYVGLLLTIGWMSRRKRQEKSLSDFYLAGRALGPFVLLTTLFATQYSGNSLSGFPGQTAREGLAYYMAVTFMVAIVVGYLPVAPRLFRAGRRNGYVTPTDYLADRYRSPRLTRLASGILVVTLVNFLLAQLIAMGHALEGLSNGAISYSVGVVAGAAIILIYELLGGMRAVAWTDAIQGLILAVGLVLIVFLLFQWVGTPGAVVTQLAELVPHKVAAPDLRVCATWWSNFLLLGLGAPLYPQAIQRIFAARRLGDLRRAFAVMAVLPHLAITTVVYIGLCGLLLFPDLSGTAADQVTFRVLGFLYQQETWAAFPVLLIMVAVVAAIMSTADSCLLSLSSLITKDWVAPWRGLNSRQAEGLTTVGSLGSIVVMGILTLLALRPPTTLWSLLVLKFEILIQLSPAFVLGAGHSRSDPSAVDQREVLTGLLCGLGLALALTLTGYRSVGGMHAGTLGVIANYGVVLALWGLRVRRVRVVA